MNKLRIFIFSAALAFTTSAFAGGTIGLKVGNGDLEGDAKSYTAGSNAYAAESGSKDNRYGAIFAELDLGDTPLSIGVEYVPFDADISLDGKNANTSANVGDYTTAYLMASREMGNGAGLYLKVGASTANIGTVSPNDAQTTVNSNSDSLDGIMVGIGFSSPENSIGLSVRAEATYTEFDTIQVTTTSNGSTSVKKEADGDLTTFSVSLAKSF